MATGTETAQIIASRLAAQVAEKGLTNQKIEAETGIPRTTLRRYLQGQKAIPVDALAVLADLLDLDLVELFEAAA